MHELVVTTIQPCVQKLKCQVIDTYHRCNLKNVFFTQTTQWTCCNQTKKGKG